MFLRLRRLTLDWWPPTACALLFFSLGWPFLRHPGIHNDEVLFTGPLFQPAIFRIPFFDQSVPLMLATYLGALKTWLYAPLLHFWVSRLSIRLPVLLIGSATVAFFFLLIDRLHGRRAAWVGAILLCTDAAFLLTTCFDWGPVALQHFFAVTGMLLAVRFAQDGSRRTLFGAFFLFGLGMWDKALFSWLFNGIAAATLVVAWAEVRKRFNRKNLITAVVAFSLGALPLLSYNVLNDFPTVRSNSAFVFDEFSGKAHVLRQTVQGDVLFGFLVSKNDGGRPLQPTNALERLTSLVHNNSGDRRAGRNEVALLVALVLLPILCVRRSGQIPLFCLVAGTLAWLQMAITKGAGAAAHHTILLWPMPQLFLAVTFAEASRWMRRFGPAMVAIVTLYLAGQNLLVLNQYSYQLVRNGPAGSWTDAIYPLAEVVPKIPASRIVIADWGILPPLELMHRGTLPLLWAGDPFLRPDANEPERKYKLAILADRQALWIGHTDEYQEFGGVNSRLLAATAAAGFKEVPVTTVSDRNGRQIFEIFRFVSDQR